MFQDYTTKVIKFPSDVNYTQTLKTTTIDAALINASQRFVDGGVNGVARQIEFDSINNNVMLSFDGSLVASEGNDFVAFVHTYTASDALDGDVDLPTTNLSLIPFFNIQGCGYFQGNVVIPRLQLSDNERQYVMVGIASPTAKASNVAMYLDMKLHLHDQQVFQPSK